MAEIVSPMWNMASSFSKLVQFYLQPAGLANGLFSGKHEDSVKKASAEDITTTSMPGHPQGSSAAGFNKLRDRSEMKNVFDLFDANKDGLVCAKDLTSLMRRIRFEGSQEEICRLVKSADINSDDFMDFEEFLSLHNSLQGKSSSEAASHGEDELALKDAFLLFDKNNDGQINVEELQQMLLDLGLREGRSRKTCQRIIQRVDSDGNGTVDFSEFKIMMSSKDFQPRHDSEKTSHHHN